MIDLKITEVEHYTDKLFRIRTERPSTYRFTAGEFVMIGLEGAPKRAYSFTSGPYDEFLDDDGISHKVDGGMSLEMEFAMLDDGSTSVGAKIV